MRLLITTYQKTGTHQLYPMFTGDGTAIPQVKDYSARTLEGLPEHLHSPINPPSDGIEKTIGEIHNIPERAFGHMPYRDEFVEALQIRPTKVLFGIRDPRDVIVSELENIKRSVRDYKNRGMGMWNWMVPNTEKMVIELDDPIAFLIEVAHYRWKNWYGWLDHDFVMPVKYEELRLKQDATINAIRQFLMDDEGVSLIHRLPDFQSMKVRSVPKLGNPTFRKGTVGDWKIYFQSHHIELGKKFLNPVMETLGYDIDWSLE
jgi:hypothetical protein